MKIKSSPTLQVVATAIAAYEHNKKSIVRNPVTIEGVGFYPNRQLITDYVTGNGGPFIVNDFHLKQAEGKYTGYCFFTDFSEAKKQILDEAEKIWASITDEDIIEKLKIGAVCWNYYLSNTQRGPYIAPDPDSRIRQIAAGLFSDKVKEYPLFRDYYPKAWVSPRVKWVKQNSEVYV